MRAATILFMAGADDNSHNENKPIPYDGRAFFERLCDVMRERFGCTSEAECKAKLVEISTVRFKGGKAEPMGEEAEAAARRRFNEWRRGQRQPRWSSVYELVAHVEQQPGQPPLHVEDLVRDLPLTDASPIDQGNSKPREQPIAKDKVSQDPPKRAPKEPRAARSDLTLERSDQSRPNQHAPTRRRQSEEGQKNLQKLRVAICEILEENPSLVSGFGNPNDDDCSADEICEKLIGTGADQIAAFLVHRLKKLRSERDPAAEDLQRLLWLVLTVAADWVDLQKQDAATGDDNVLELRLRTATVADIAVARHEEEVCSFAPVFTDGKHPQGTLSIPTPAAAHAPIFGRLDFRQPELLKKTFLGDMRDVANEPQGGKARYPFWNQVLKANPSVGGFDVAVKGEIAYRQSEGRRFYLLYIDELLSASVTEDLDAHWSKAVAVFRSQLPALRLVRLRGLEGDLADREYSLVPPIRDALLKGREI